LFAAEGEDASGPPAALRKAFYAPGG